MKCELTLRIALHSKNLPDNVVELLVPLQDALLRRLQEDLMAERKTGWRGMGSFTWEEIRVPGVRSKMRVMFEESKDEKVQKWLQQVNKRAGYKLDSLTQDK